MSETITAGIMPVLALRGLTIFPDQTVHFEVGRKKSVLALEEAMKKDQTLLLIPQRDMTVDDPTMKDLYPIGTVVRVKQVLKSHNENVRVLVDGMHRARLIDLENLKADYIPLYKKGTSTLSVKNKEVFKKWECE